MTTIVETWFVNDKGPGEIESGGFGRADEALRPLAAATAAFDGR